MILQNSLNMAFRNYAENTYLILLPRDIIKLLLIRSTEHPVMRWKLMTDRC